MKINIICSESKGDWMYGRFVKEFKKHSKNKILLNSKTECDVVHFLPYYSYDKNLCRNTPSTSWQSYQDDDRELNNKFVLTARSVDCAISHSKKYADILRDKYNLQTVQQIIPGVDLDAFTLRDEKRASNSSKMIVGYVGREYTSSDRKNPKLLKRISEMPTVDFRTTGGSMAFEDVPEFYRGLDLVISPATIEGGPMAIQEALACGVPVLSMKGVGVTDEFGPGVIMAEDDEDFIRQIKLIQSSKQHLEYWRKPGIMKQLRQQVLNQTWEKFVAKHDKIWEMITKESWKTSRS